jgi:RimJ/RimL family protein N-acetyltransferase
MGIPAVVALVRRALEEDAPRVVELTHAVDAETEQMLFEPGERSRDVEAQRARLREYQRDGETALFVADDGVELVGYLLARGGHLRRIQHVVEIVVGVRARAQGKGIARSLFAAAEAWAVARGVTRLELGVLVTNPRALRLYESLGFVREGVRRQAVRIDGEPVDSITMGKLLAPRA